MATLPAEMLQFRQDAEYYAEHYEDLRERYADRWVAIYHREVVADAPTLDDLLTELERRGVPAEAALVKYTGSGDTVFVL